MKSKYFILFILISIITSCTDKFEDFNKDPKNPEVVNGESLFSGAQVALADQLTNSNVNLNIWRLWAQYWTETTYTDEANYDIVNRTIADNTFQEYYRDVLKDLAESKKILTETAVVLPETQEQRNNKILIIGLVESYVYQQLVDIFGMVPYSEALDIENLTPVFESGSVVYGHLIDAVNAAITGLDVTSESFGSADLYYGGDTETWLKFANVLKLKLGITLADVNPALSRTLVEEAVAGGLFTSSDEDCQILYLKDPPNTNALFEDLVLSGRRDFVPANTIVDIMNKLNDPRSDVYFSAKKDTSTEAGVVKLAYKGGAYGYNSSYSRYSHPGAIFYEPDLPGKVLTYVESLFYLAEAAARGYNVGSTVEDLYSLAITESILDWGLSIEDANAYLAQPSVAYATAEGGWAQKIGTQSWIALYNRGLEGYTQWRRLDYPIFNVARRLDAYENIPKRFTFPIYEQTLNKTNYTAAAAAIGAGGDELTTRIFWDLY